MHWYKFNIGDYLTDTMHLADAEDLAYRRLIDLYYMSERPIPLDVAYVTQVEKNKVSAKLGGRPKKTELESESDPNRNPNKNKNKNKTPQTPLAGGLRFAEFWSAWPASPRKVGKASCEKK
jgi:hypothetical protein